MNQAAELTPAEKRHLLKNLLRNERPPARLSEAQARLWELERSSPGVHDFSLAYSLVGPLDADLLDRALYAVANHHPSLRSHIVGTGNAARFEDIALPESVLARVQCAGNLEEQLRCAVSRALDPATGFGWQATLFRASENEHTLLLHFHHILADRWSAGILVTDLAVAYRALKRGERPFSAPAPAEGSGETASVPEVNAGLPYWQELFAPPVEELLLPRARQTAFAGYAGGRIETELDKATTEALKCEALSQSTTLFTTLLAAFAAFLHAHTGQRDLVICTPFAGRQRTATRRSIGYFNNILPLRIQIPGDPEFRELAASVAGQTRNATKHQHVPFHRITGLPQLAGQRIARCLFTMQNIPGLDLILPNLESSYRDIFNGTANFDLSLFAEEENGRLRMLFDFKTAVLDQAAAVELSHRFIAFVRTVVERPTQRLSTFPYYRSPAAPTPAASTQAAPLTVHAQAADLNLLEQKMVDLWQEVFPELPADTIDADTQFFSIGGDSLRAARLFALIRRDFKMDLPLATLFEAATPRELVERIGDRDWIAPWLSLIPVKVTGERPPLFCVHGGGGNVIAFRFLAECLDQDRPLYCLQAKGLHPDDEPHESVEEIARHYVQSVTQLRPSGPYLLTGHSLGAAVAYEMAQILVNAGEDVAFLGLLDHPGPDIRLSKLDWLKYQLIAASMFSPREYAQYVWHGIRWRLRARAAQKRIAGGGRVQSSSVDLVERAFRALRNYAIQPYPGRISLFRAQKGPAKIRSDRYGGWGSVGGQGVDVYEVPGTHMSMLEQPHVQNLAAAISRCLDDR